MSDVKRRVDQLERKLLGGHKSVWLYVVYDGETLDDCKAALARGETGRLYVICGPNYRAGEIPEGATVQVIDGVDLGSDI